jgi:DNA processing protein
MTDVSPSEPTVRAYRYLRRREQAFPRLLSAIHDPPAGLFLRGSGSLELLQRPCVAVVGARACSAYGARVARRLGRELAQSGAVVVSGLARGVDGEAHRGALEGGGPTVAVLGCGIDRDYPQAHARLAARICEQGLLVSEYEPGVPPAPWRFPARNRIVAGLCAATVVVEARARSGALITADFALEQGRDVWAVPGEITSALSHGTNHLLRLGAAPLLEVEELVEALGLAPAPAPATPHLSGSAALVHEALSRAPASLDELARSCGLAADALAAAVVELELAGEAVCGDGVYRRTR